MRVGLLIYGSLETISGGFLYDRKLVEHLRATGDHVEIISLPWRNYPRHLLDNLSQFLLKKFLNLQIDVMIQDELNHPSLAWLNGKIHAPFPMIALVHHLRCDELRVAGKTPSIAKSSVVILILWMALFSTARPRNILWRKSL